MQIYTIEKWNKYYEFFKEYVKEHGEYPDRKYMRALSYWVDYNAKILNNGKYQYDGSINYDGYILTEEQVIKLLDFYFIQNKGEYKWNIMYDFLERYLEKNDGKYPNDEVIFDNRKVLVWFRNQKTLVENGIEKEDGTICYDKFTLTSLQVKKIKYILSKYNKYTSRKKWDEIFEELKNYLKNNNDEYPKDGPLVHWIDSQRLVYNKGIYNEDGSIVYYSKTYKQTLTKKQIDKLKSIGFIFNIKMNKWLKKYALFLKFIKLNKRSPKEDEIFENEHLGKWFFKQCKIYNCGDILKDGSIVYNGCKLSEEQVSLLDNIRDYVIDTFTKNYEACIDYLFENNYTKPGKKEVYNGAKIGSFYSFYMAAIHNGKKQKDDSIVYKNRIINKKQADMLIKVENIIETNSNRKWYTKYKLLLKFLKNNNFEYPKKDVVYEGERIGEWVCTQRCIYINGNLRSDGSIFYNGSILTKEQIDLLDKINFEWFKSDKKFRTMEITFDNRTRIEKEILKRFMKVLETEKEINNIEKEFYNSFENKRTKRVN